MENIIFTTTIPVQVNHLNYGNHLGYDSVLSIMQEARMRWLTQNNMSELSIDNKVGYLITKVTVDYKSEAFFGDTLLIKLSVINLRKKSFEFKYEIVNKESGKRVSVATTTHMFYDRHNKKISSAPNSFVEKINLALESS